MTFVPGAVSYTGSHYDFVLNLIRGMIEGTVDVFVLEGELHKVLDSGACMAYTVEKILQNIVRQVGTQTEFVTSLYGPISGVWTTKGCPQGNLYFPNVW